MRPLEVCSATLSSTHAHAQPGSVEGYARMVRAVLGAGAGVRLAVVAARETSGSGGLGYFTSVSITAEVVDRLRVMFNN